MFSQHARDVFMLRCSCLVACYWRPEASIDLHRCRQSYSNVLPGKSLIQYLEGVESGQFDHIWPLDLGSWNPWSQDAHSCYRCQVTERQKVDLNPRCLDPPKSRNCCQMLVELSAFDGTLAGMAFKQCCFVFRLHFETEQYTTLVRVCQRRPIVV